MSARTTHEYESTAVDLLARLMPWEEEQNPLPEDPSPGMLVARVTERLAQAGFELKQLRDPRSARRKGPASLLQVGVFFLGAAAFAIDALPHIHPDGEEVAPTEFKDLMLAEPDRRIEDSIAEGCFEKVREEDWLSNALALVVGACHSTCALEGVGLPGGPADEESIEDELMLEDDYDLDFDEDEDAGEDEEDESEVDWEECCTNVDDQEAHYLYGQVADSLFSSAVASSLAATWFIERHDRAEAQRQKRQTARKRSRKTAGRAR